MQSGTARGPIWVAQSSGDAEQASRLKAMADPASYCVRINGISNSEIVNTETQVTSVVNFRSNSRDWAEITRIASTEAKVIVSNTCDTGPQATPSDDDATFKQSMPYPAKLMHLLRMRYWAGPAPV